MPYSVRLAGNLRFLSFWRYWRIWPFTLLLFKDFRFLLFRGKIILAWAKNQELIAKLMESSPEEDNWIVTLKFPNDRSLLQQVMGSNKWHLFLRPTLDSESQPQ